MDFTQTRWSLVLAAGESESPHASAALESLCRAYWHPLYAHVRRRGYDVDAAQDLTQAFFEHLLQKRSLRLVEPRRGKFRSFLLACLGNFLARDWRDGHTLKRGGGVSFVPADWCPEEDRFAGNAAAEESPEMVYDRAWAEAILDHALARMEREAADAGKAGQFAALKPFLIAPTPNGAYASVAPALHMTPHAVGMAIMRLRQRFRDVVREAVAHTVATPLELEEELRYFRQLISQ